ncbi:putative wall-associated receptor kinase-like 13 [Camellia lanceoleosa]|uniref:Wall-associated receptor kinase-like 13 n=1 Tax=Camellia lanceoleosa TaxID=1840588 RepID=A0ACC0HIW7_9ERIC|nr:putative wall-associated receptor kinase-like 13 [Camellia lanceoleosa]
MLLWLTNTSAYRYTQDGCPTWCGNVRIPFPFGIDVNCSLNEWYSIECRNSSRSSDYYIEGTPYLTKISLECYSGGYSGLMSKLSGSSHLVSCYPNWVCVCDGLDALLCLEMVVKDKSDKTSKDTGASVVC